MKLPSSTKRRRRERPRIRLAATFAGLLCALAAPAAAQQSGGLGDVFGDVGTAEVVDDRADLAPDLAEDEGTVVGQVVDAESGVGVANATVILIWPAPADGDAARQEVALTNAAGEFRFPRVAQGVYRLSFVKSGYVVSAMTDFTVEPGQLNVADFPLPPRAADVSGDVLSLEAFVVEEAMVGDLLEAVELRMDADALVDVMGTEDLSKFAASDVGDALKRVSGVNVVEGRFAVIRGLEDRYSSTVFNGAPIPSADPQRQSVQLDLFPSDIVSGIVVAKTFEAATPGNSGAGSIDIGTMGYPDELTLKLNAGTGVNENAADRFLGYRESSPIAKFGGGTGVVESDLSLSIGGRRDFWDRDFRAKAVFAREIDYDTAIGVNEAREPRLADYSFNPNTQQVTAVRSSGGLAFRELAVSDGRFEWELSQRSEQYTYFGALGLDLDRNGEHRIDFTAFHTEKAIEAVERRDNGYIPGFDYAGKSGNDMLQPGLYGTTIPRSVATVGSMLNQFRSDIEQLDSGPLSFDPIVRGESILQDRRLSVAQLNGEHDLADWLGGLEFSWATNYARTRQDETAFRARYWWELYEFEDTVNPPVVPFPPQVADFAAFGPGSWRTNARDVIYFDNRIDEEQYFARGDFSYAVEPADGLAAVLGTGFWYETAERTLSFQEYLGGSPIAGRPGVVDGRFVEGPSEAELGPNTFFGLGLDDLGAPGVSTFEREIVAGHLDLKLTLREDLDLIGGVRLEQIEILSNNRPFTGSCSQPLQPPGQPSAFDPSKSGLGCPAGYLPKIFPTQYLYLDRFDNPGNPYLREDASFSRTGVFPDLVLGIDLPTDANGLVDVRSTGELFDRLSGEIDELKVLPMASLAYRPAEGLTLRSAYSETASRPSFRELAYYASLVPGVSDRIVGNPFLELSDVGSFDARIEYLWGDLGELVAASFFYKTIEKPIELIVLRDYSVNDPLFQGPFRVYRNNENEAELLGMELESRVTLGLLGAIGNRGKLGHWADWSSALEYFSLGGNYSYIDASVARSDYEQRLAFPFYLATAADRASGRVLATQLPSERRLYNQPEWTANADVSFDQPDWGTKLTLSVFAISDVLNAAGSADLAGNGRARGYVLDEYIDSFYQLDFVLSQSFEIPRTPGGWTARVSVKNFTDSERGIIYDPEVTRQVYRSRTFTVGRDYTFSLQYQWSF